MADVDNVILKHNKAKVKPKPIRVWFHIKHAFYWTYVITLTIQFCGIGWLLFCIQTKRPEYLMHGLIVIASSGVTFILGLFCVVFKIFKLKRFYRRIR